MVKVQSELNHGSDYKTKVIMQKPHTQSSVMFNRT